MSNGTVTQALDVLWIQDDEECVRILQAADHLKDARVIPPFNTANLVFNHAGHHVLCFYREGFIHGGDNGYEMFLIPFDAATPEEVAVFFAAIIQADTVLGNVSREKQMLAYAPVEG